jgi:nitroreductase
MLLNRLRSVRHFRPDPVPAIALDDILAVARWSGSARNRQPWQFIVVRDRATLAALAAVEGFAKHLAGAPLAIVLVMDGEPDFEEQEVFDEGRLSERIQLAAAVHGLGSCVGWFKGDGSADAKAILGIPAGRRVRTALSIGHVDSAARATRNRPEQPRKPLADIVHWERYRGGADQ